jgi:hypothetical protein
MADETEKDQEPTVASAEEAPDEQPKVLRAFAKAGRILDEDELTSPVAAVMLYETVNRLEAEKAELSRYRSRFYETDRECAVLKERARASTLVDVLSTIAVALGGVLLGASPWLSSAGKELAAPQNSSYLSAGAGVVLLLVGAFLQLFSRR